MTSTVGFDEWFSAVHLPTTILVGSSVSDGAGWKYRILIESCSSGSIPNIVVTPRRFDTINARSRRCRAKTLMARAVGTKPRKLPNDELRRKWRRAVSGPWIHPGSTSVARLCPMATATMFAHGPSPWGVLAHIRRERRFVVNPTKKHINKKHDRIHIIIGLVTEKKQ
jgi:hypothetical protein